MELTDFSRAATLKLQGIWEEIGSGGRIKVAATNNPLYRKRLRELTKPHARAIRAGTFAESEMENILTQLIAETILLDWQGISENGKPVPFSRETAKELLEKYEEFRELVLEVANDHARFRQEWLKEAEKN